MPIYAYRCDHCGHAKDVLQKLSDPVLSACPACGMASFRKQVTAAGFQLKGSGWYVTDFRGGNSAAKPEPDGARPADAKPADSKPADSKADGAKPASTPAPAAAAGSSDSTTAGGGASCASQ